MYSLVYFFKKECYMSKQVHLKELVRNRLCVNLGDYFRFNTACLCRNLKKIIMILCAQLYKLIYWTVINILATNLAKTKY